MDAWETLTAGSTITEGDAWGHLQAQGGGGNGTYIILADGMDIEIEDDQLTVMVPDDGMDVEIEDEQLTVTVSEDVMVVEIIDAPYEIEINDSNLEVPTI